MLFSSGRNESVVVFLHPFAVSGSGTLMELWEEESSLSGISSCTLARPSRISSGFPKFFLQ